MTKKHNFYLALGIVAILTLVLAVPVSADGSPALPEQFYGSLTINSAPAPLNTHVVAYIDGVARGDVWTNYVGSYGGTSGWENQLIVTGDMTDVGDTIFFFVDGHQALQTAVYTPNIIQNLALTVSFVTPTPTTTPTTIPTTVPTTVPTTTPTTPPPTINVVAQGGDIFIGEEGLNIVAAMGGFTQVAHFESGTDPLLGSPNKVITIPTSAQGSYFVDPVQYIGYTGNWYRWTNGANTGVVAFNVVDPSIAIYVWDQKTGMDASGRTIPVGNFGNFRIETNLYTITQRPGYTGQGFITIKVQSPDGGIYTALYQSASVSIALTNRAVNQPVWYWVVQNDPTKGWNTGYKDASNARVYQDGMYRVWAESNVNGIKDNYKDPSGNDYLGKTVSFTKTVTVQSKQLTLSANKASLIRGEGFSVTLSGDPNTDYVIWIRHGCTNMSGLPCYQPPTIAYNQEGVFRDSSLGCTCFNCEGCIKDISNVVAPYQLPTDYYARVRTDANGTRTIDFLTNIDTAPGLTYTIAGLLITPDLCTVPHIPVETSVLVNKGVVSFNLYTYGTAPVSSAYLGDKIWIRGTSTDPSGYVYLMMIGPCQDCVGANLNGTTVQNNVGSTFTKVQVKSDHTWEYLWDTTNLKIDLGDYTIYAASKPNDVPSLEGIQCSNCDKPGYSCAAWSKKPLKFLDPTIIADIHPKVLKIVCCDPVSIIVSGQATGIRRDSCVGCVGECAEVGIWVFGENKVAGNKYIFNIVKTDCPSGSFSIDLKNYLNTLKLEPGTYTVVVQHPMYNRKLDIIPDKWLSWWCLQCGYSCSGTCACDQCSGYPRPDCCDTCCNQGLWTCCGVYTNDSNKEYVISASPVRWSKLLVIDGPDRLVGWGNISGPFRAGFNDPAVDDKIVVLNFKVESNTAVQADFSGIPTSGIAPLTVQFTDTSTGGPTQWSWAFGDGTTSSLKNPQHIYTGPGSYDVSLTVTNAYGSSTITKNAYITVTEVGPTVTPTIPPVNPNIINLYTGWNFISTPKTLADGSNTVGVVFADVNTGGRSVYLYDASTGLWKAMMASDQFLPLDGIWIYSMTPKQVNLVFKSVGATTPPTKNVYQGWNAIGFSGVDPRSAAATLATVNDPPRKVWSQVIGWNSASQVYKTPIANVYPDNAAQMVPTNGYWLFMNGDNPPWVLS